MEGEWNGIVTVSGINKYDAKRLTMYRTTRSDWLAWEAAREPLERAIPAF